MSSRAVDGLRGVGDQGAVDGVGDAALEASKRFSVALAFSLSAEQIVSAVVIGSGLGNGRDVERAVEFPVAAAAESVALGPSG